ncbi:sodium:solute symporter family protein [Aquibacillus koreensis]|uniref:Sodium:solute symporter family protein n=1 Tax=Aquibacillus koreensis TaxID=279446 RepID=A0A9X3WMQ1_9BACI|nr:sodium:solute symporter family protein [Aquibacillus koreensis]MCT2535345.1 sodium:solute symporter family protein [Aquibacillus koreensis]MDC3422510.1 sodium:solute symporter family protein [Aquibacillus koreensis]
MPAVSGALFWTIIIILVVYFAVVIWVGSKGSKFSNSMVGFATARGKVKPWLVGASFAASYASANLFIGVPGLAYQYGTSVLWYTIGCFGLSWLGLLLFAKTFWRYGKKFGGVSTLPEWLGKRYNSKALQVLVSILILFNVYYIVGQNVGLATIFETVLNIPYLWGIIIGVTITILYIGLGGAFAQIVTDGIQGVLMAVTSVLLLLSLFWTIGGGFNVFGQLSSKLEAIDPNLISPLSNGGPYDSWVAIAAVQFLLFSFVLMPHLLNKVLSIETEEDLKPFTLSAGVVLFLISTLMVLGGLAARVLAPSLDSADAAIPVYILDAFPPIVAAIMIVGIISAILSSTDSLYLGVTSSIGNDFYKVLAPIFSKKQVSEAILDRNAVRVAKGSLLFVGLATLYISLDRPESLSILIQFSFSAIISGIIAPVTLGYFWKKANGYGSIAALITGTALYVLFTSQNLIANIYIAMFFSSVAAFAVMYVISLLTYKGTVSHQGAVTIGK